MNPVLLAIDEGTTNAKAACIDGKGQILARGSTSLKVTHPRPAWTEQDPREIIEGVRAAIAQATASIDGPIIGLGISNQRESVLIWERATGRPLSPVVVWQCRRSEEICEQLAQSQDIATIQEKTGLPIDPLFPAAKIRWLLDALPAGQARAENGEICIGTIDAWLVWHLSGGRAFVTDQSNAARTQLCNIHTQQWDEELCRIFTVPIHALPQICPSSGVRAETSGFTGLPDGLPILSQVGDSHAALYGQGGFVPGVIKATYGTGSSLMTPVPALRAGDYRLAQTIAWHDGELSYALEGNITHTGAGADYMGQLIGVRDTSELAELARQTKSNDGVYFVPALSGLGAPHWQTRARGLITGLTDSAGPEHLARAALEAIAYQVADVFALMEEMSGESLDCLLVDGGPTRNDWLMQFQANVIGRPVVRTTIAEVSALGAGYLAGKALGWWPSRQQLAALDRRAEKIFPDTGVTAAAEGYQGWQRAVQQTLFDR